MVSTSIHFSVNDIISFFFMAECNSAVWTPRFLDPFISDGRRGRFGCSARSRPRFSELPVIPGSSGNKGCISRAQVGAPVERGEENTYLPSHQLVPGSELLQGSQHAPLLHPLLQRFRGKGPKGTQGTQPLRASPRSPPRTPVQSRAAASPPGPLRSPARRRSPPEAAVAMATTAASPAAWPPSADHKVRAGEAVG
ncbi:Hypothetical predicted protein [Marmota monax]|uniref:Uncharacterized protein n=1 Tax=Marmota monax TaxID=9995 RepID=A0A5E4BIK7_MARMO|nr:Hypothetical predicted protein [Marmota monax]